MRRTIALALLALLVCASPAPAQTAADLQLVLAVDASGSVDRVRLRWRSGKAIELGWDAKLTPYVGVWVCNGDLGGYRQIAIEPATGGNDRPDPSQPPPLLAPGKELRWVFGIAPLD